MNRARKSMGRALISRLAAGVACISHFDIIIYLLRYNYQEKRRSERLGAVLYFALDFISQRVEIVQQSGDHAGIGLLHDLTGALVRIGQAQNTLLDAR